jgi:hypothetical protein
MMSHSTLLMTVMSFSVSQQMGFQILRASAPATGRRDNDISRLSDHCRKSRHLHHVAWRPNLLPPLFADDD